MNFDCKENGIEKAFLAKPKRQYHGSQWGKHDCSAKLKKWRSLQEPKFVVVDGQTLIIRRMVESKSFLAKPKHQYHASKWGKRDYSA